jgi:hypothetical protein
MRLQLVLSASGQTIASESSLATKRRSLIVFAVEYKFHETSHLSARAAERSFSVEQAIETVKAPSSVVKNPHKKGNHGGLIRLFFRSYGSRVLVVVAEVRKHECWIITGYWASH